MSRVGRLAETLGNVNFRRYAGAQLLHAAGTWAQRIAELWLVYEITKSALAVGVATAARAGSSLLLAPLAGLLADRIDRRLLLASTQSSKAVVAGILATAVVLMGDIPLALLLGVIVLLGIIGAIDTPLRRAFVRDVVTVKGLEGAARLHTSVMSVGRIAGGGLAAMLLGVSATWACFAVNCAASVVASLLILRVVPTTATVLTAATPAAGDRLFAYLRRTPAVTVPLALLGCFTLMGWNLEVLIPVLIDDQLESEPATFGLLMLAMSVGSLMGSVIMASSRGGGTGSLAVLLAVYGAAIVPLAAVQHLLLALLAFMLIGACGGGFLSLANSSVQTAADPGLQGRVAAAYGVVFVGARAVGGPMLGWMVDALGSQQALVIVGVATTACALLGYFSIRRTSCPVQLS